MVVATETAAPVGNPRAVSREKGRMSLAAFKAEFGHLEVKRPDRWEIWMLISPTTAQALLDRFNKRNRNVNKNRVRTYSADIRDGRWHETGQPIIITEDGITATGQHTLLAVIEAGVSIVSLVVVGVPRESIFYVDLGRAKQLKDFLTLQNQVGAAAIQTAVNWKAAYDGKCLMDPQRKAELTTAFKLEVVIPSHPGLIKCLQEIPAPNPGFGGRSMWAWLYYEFQARDAGLARDYVWQVLEGTGISKSSPVYALRRNFERKSKGGRGQKMTGLYAAAIAIKTWNRLRGAGGSGDVAIWRADEKFPEIR